MEIVREKLGLSPRRRGRKGSALARGCHMGRGRSGGGGRRREEVVTFFSHFWSHFFTLLSLLFHIFCKLLDFDSLFFTFVFVFFVFLVFPFVFTFFHFFSLFFTFFTFVTFFLGMEQNPENSLFLAKNGRKRRKHTSDKM